MRGALFAYSRQGCARARQIAAALPEVSLRCYAAARLEEAGFEGIGQPSRDVYGAQFAGADVLIFVGACGIAVRAISPHIQRKDQDPAVLVVDEGGRFVLPILSGHIGGANRLARTLAQALGATPVITTATDGRGRFSVDEWAARRGYVIGDLDLAKQVSAAILEGEVPLLCDLPCSTPYPQGVAAGKDGPLGIYVGYRKTQPFARTLSILPPGLHLGIGCRKGISRQAIEEGVWRVLEEHDLDRRAICSVASIDLKAAEPGLLAFAQANGWPLRCYSSQELLAVEGQFTASDFVRSVAGVDNVCERAARMEAEHLIVTKTAWKGVTVALAAEKVEVSFG